MIPSRSSVAVACALMIALTGCASISKGITEAVLDRKVADTRKCDINGGPFEGVRQSLERQTAGHSTHTTKILMVHGIKKHLPEYSTRFQEKLTRSLKLDVKNQEVKQIKLSVPKAAAQDETFKELGELQISRYTNHDQTQELLFYELTWSPITEPQKELIAYDDGDSHSFRRAQLNGLLKSFLNSTVPDLLIYMGNRSEHINLAVSQSVCWMFHGRWEDLPSRGSYACDPAVGEKYKSVEQDDFYFVTHSLGSRITIDTINQFAQTFEKSPYRGQLQRVVKALQQKEIKVFMLANQLPLLQMGRPGPAVTGRIKEYCAPGAPLAGERIIGRTRIIAFNDPNDMLSYPVPPRYAEEHIDSRICPDIANVNINVAQVTDVFGATNFADPSVAHGDYENDNRVVALITDGISRTHRVPILRKRCNWTEVVP